MCPYFGAFVCPTTTDKLPDAQGNGDSIYFIPCGELKLPIRENTPFNLSPLLLAGQRDVCLDVASTFYDG